VAEKAVMGPALGRRLKQNWSQ